MAKARARVGHKLHVVIVSPSGCGPKDLDDEAMLSLGRQVGDGVHRPLDGHRGQACLGVRAAEGVVSAVVLDDSHDVVAGRDGPASPQGRGQRVAQVQSNVHSAWHGAACGCCGVRDGGGVDRDAVRGGVVSRLDEHHGLGAPGGRRRGCHGHRLFPVHNERVVRHRGHSEHGTGFTGDVEIRRAVRLGHRLDGSIQAKDFDVVVQNQDQIPDGAIPVHDGREWTVGTS